jgi:uncharacterized membrane protein
MQNAKSLFESKTFWLAILQAAVGVLVVFGTSYPTVGWIVMAKSALDVVVRLYTSVPISSITPAAE